MDFFLNGAELSVKFSKFRESDKSTKHELGSIYKDLVSHLCLAGAVVAS